jgi:predicted phosphatase
MIGSSMRIRTSELPVVIDVDETLINKVCEHSFIGVDNVLKLNYYGRIVYTTAIERHVDLLKSYKQRGYEVTVWSANGYQWAKEVITKLDLLAYVDEVASKPLKYVDDKDANDWMARVFINE